ncbi:MAG: PhzF family phenazine biosynthesis protein [Pseudomonadota bacterium]
MEIRKLSAFCLGPAGGNPAGVVVDDALPERETMQRIAREIGFSETVFCAKSGDGFQVRYFSPEMEIDFCGHATIALAGALSLRTGGGRFRLHTLNGPVDTEGQKISDGFAEAGFVSPACRHATPAKADIDLALDLFGLERSHLFREIAPALIHAGADHLLLPLRDRGTLASMDYDFERGKRLMREKGWVTIMLAQPESHALFHVRNAFAYGGVQEDPATGAAAAALAGYLRASGYAPGTRVEIHQGDDMGMPCRLYATTPGAPGAGVKVSGTARVL